MSDHDASWTFYPRSNPSIWKLHVDLNVDVWLSLHMESAWVTFVSIEALICHNLIQIHIIGCSDSLLQW